MKPILYLHPLESQGRTWPYEAAISPDGLYPECPKHGAMSCVAASLKLWRCLACELGTEVERCLI